jgi:gamma-glutamyltranspeptidase
MQEAVNAPRFHHQWLPDEITFEPNSFDKELLVKARIQNSTKPIKETRTGRRYLVCQTENWKVGLKRGQ